MPRLATFHGIVVYMYVRDHGVAHFHARYGDEEAVIEVATRTVLPEPAAWSDQAGQPVGPESTGPSYSRPGRGPATESLRVPLSRCHERP